MKKLLVLFILSFNFIIAQNIGPNFIIYPGSITQTEPVITVSPLDKNILFASAVTINTDNFFKSEGVYISTDAGVSWRGTDTCKGQSIVNHGGDPGVLVDYDGRFILTHNGSIFSGVYSHFSTDMGLNWSNSITVTDEQPEDKSTITIDDSPESPFYKRIYLTWVEYVSPYPVYFAYTNNITEGWTTPQIVNEDPPARSSGGTVITDRNGNVYTCWAGMTQSFPPKEDYAGFAKSTDGGVTWNVQQNIFDMNGIAGTLPSKGNIKVNGLPRIAVDKSGGEKDGWIYIVTTEKNISPAGSDPDLILHRSTDGGNSWSAGIKINQDLLNNGKIQYFPALSIDDSGNLNVLYYDDRNTSSDSTEVFLARSTDGGNSWNEFVVSDHRFKPKPILGGSSNYQGDHIDLIAVDNKLYAVWMGDHSGIYQVWCSIIEFEPDAIENEITNPQDFKLYQNYPNPFNPSTKIKYQVPKNSFVTVKVFDILGNEIATLVNENKSPGIYAIDFLSDNIIENKLSSGIYLYQLKAGNFIQNKKMILLR